MSKQSAKQPSEDGDGNHKPSKGIYILPNLFTTGGLFAGFYAIVAATQGKFEPAAVAIFIAMVMDGLDGRVARMTNTTSDFGVEYDSLADMIAFGLSPSLVVYEWALMSKGKLGWLVAFIYVASVALRLARFNTQKVQDKRYFQGLPSPAGAAFMAALVWICVDRGVSAQSIVELVLVLTVAIGAAMVSNIRYRSFKDLDLKDRVPFVAILVVVLIYVIISLDPPTVLFFIATVYALSGPLSCLLRWRKRQKQG